MLALNKFSQTDPILSIITVTMNDIHRLDKTINSVKAYYGLARFEHIIVDGNSQDGTNALINGFKNYQNVRSISEFDNGLYDAMNKGIRLSQGKYLLFLNCGDLLLSSPHQLIGILDQINEDCFDIACFPSLITGESSIQILRPNTPGVNKMPTSHQAMFFLRSFAAEHLFNTRYKIAADFDLYLRADRNRVVILNDLLPLTSIELEGIASNSPVLAYKEYIHIIYERLHGILKISALIRVVAKSIAVIIMKKLFPKKWVFKLRSIL